MIDDAHSARSLPMLTKIKELALYVVEVEWKDKELGNWLRHGKYDLKCKVERGYFAQGSDMWTVAHANRIEFLAFDANANPGESFNRVVKGGQDKNRSLGEFVSGRDGLQRLLSMASSEPYSTAVQRDEPTHVADRVILDHATDLIGSPNLRKANLHTVNDRRFVVSLCPRAYDAKAITKTTAKQYLDAKAGSFPKPSVTMSYDDYTNVALAYCEVYVHPPPSKGGPAPRAWQINARETCVRVSASGIVEDVCLITCDCVRYCQSALCEHGIAVSDETGQLSLESLMQKLPARRGPGRPRKGQGTPLGRDDIPEVESGEHGVEGTIGFIARQLENRPMWYHNWQVVVQDKDGGYELGTITKWFEPNTGAGKHKRWRVTFSNGDEADYNSREIAVGLERRQRFGASRDIAAES